MTDRRDFKKLVRARMAKTGERYAIARAHVVAGAAEEALTAGGLFPGVRSVGGQQPDLAAARNLCTNSGALGPDGAPLSEALAFGLAGGVGFLYGVFEYAEGPTMTITTRNRSMPDSFIEPLFERLGVTVELVETGGAKTAARRLDEASAAGRPSLCTVGAGSLDYLGMRGEAAAMTPHIVGVVGADGDEVLLDDRAPVPLAVPRAQFDAARAAYAKAKHRMLTIEPAADPVDWLNALAAAVAAGTAGFDTPPVPQFAANVGLRGLTRFHRLLTDRTDKKGWPTVFGEGRRAAIGLTRLTDCIHYAYTAPAAGRPLQAEFLDGAAALAGRPGWSEAAALYRASGEGWNELARLSAAAHPAIAEYAELADRRAAALDGGAPDPAEMRAWAERQVALLDECDLTATATIEAFERLAGPLGAIIDHERAALALLAQPAGRHQPLSSDG